MATAQHVPSGQDFPLHVHVTAVRKLVLLKRLIQDQGNDFYPLFWWQGENTVKRPSSVSEHSPGAACPPSASVLLPLLLPRQPIGKLLSARLLCKASSLRIFFQMVPVCSQTPLPGVRAGTAVTLAGFVCVFLIKKSQLRQDRSVFLQHPKT